MKKSKKINICIIRNDRMGDMILTLPIIKEIKDCIPNSNIYVVSSKTNFFLCKEASFIDEYLIYDKKFTVFKKIKFLKKFRNLSFDFVFNFNQNIESFLLFLVSDSIKKSLIIYLSRYRNPNFSKILQRLLIRFLNINYIQIDRNNFFKNEINFHQTEIMYQCVKKDLSINKPKSFYFLPKKNNLKNYFQERILLHLSNKWIDNIYNEELFFELLENLSKKYGKLYLSTDQTSNNNFKKVYESFVKYNDKCLHKLHQSNEEIIILDKLNFENWRKAIISSKLVITYECGCVHVASMSNVPLIIVYDYKNKPHMIHKEYAPYTSNYEKVIVNQELINQEIMIKLKKIKPNIHYKT